MAPAIKHKVHSLPGVEHLYSVICKDQLEIPAYIRWGYFTHTTQSEGSNSLINYSNSENDMAINGLHYFQPFNSNAFAS